ncbi:sporulation membrane protein YtaF [Jeotgalibacillus proteolyticus]|uniref:Sporulation membrane protein YtaF n=1 Tax=Jeotgalibacillus proteolyticus TaxID=2082395 RepID=A0A2S5GCB5_9BACL|nr:sporulation membrane protein YtaF [Jeotgalibacillus proteolyticus]PPA70677.1 sporulation membrane protein YtaF [Jeotgalibacillus proteolyticus]
MLVSAWKLLLILAVSMDSFGVGVSYGLRRITIPLAGLCTIMCCSGIMVILSMSAGLLLTSYISVEIIEIFGGLILISIGFISLNAARSQGKKQKVKEELPRRTIEEEASGGLLKKVKLVIRVLKSSQEADVDRNKKISFHEGILLGIVLGLDAFGAGLGAALLGYSLVITSCLIAFLSAAFVFTGMKTGFYLTKWKWAQKMSFIPPCLLIGIGLFYMF